MTSSSFYLKRPQKNSSDKRKDFSLQGKCLSQKNKSNFSVQKSFTEIKNDKIVISSIFDSFPSNFSYRCPRQKLTLKNNNVHSFSSPRLDINKVSSKQTVHYSKKTMFEQIISKDLTQICEMRNKNEQIKKLNRAKASSQSRNNLSNLSKYLNQQIEHQYKKIQKLKIQNEKKNLQSTNISITSFSYRQKEQERYKQKQPVFSKFFSRNTQQQIRKRIQSSRSGKPTQQVFSDLETQKKEENELPEIQIRLSLKSMSKSQQGNNEQDIVQKESQLNEQDEKIISIDKKDIKLKAIYQNKQILSSRNFKHHRMLIRIDKKFILNSNQFNNPSLKIQKIKPLTQRVKTQLP